MATPPKATPRLGLGGEPTALELERSLAASLSPGHPLAAYFHAPEGMLLLRESPGLTGFFAGSLSSLAMEEVFGHILTGIRSGQLLVQHGEVQRTVTFRDGQALFAVSSVRHERLGAVAVRLGFISSEQLHRALAKVTPTQRIGQVLTREGFLSESHLYSAMTYLVREVVLGLFEMREGSFLFLEGRPPETGDSVKLPERTRDLVLQGLKRGETVARLRRRFPDELHVALSPEAPPPEPGEEALFEKASGGTTMRELGAVWEGSLHSFLSWVEKRVGEGALLVQQPTPKRPSGSFVAPPPSVAPLGPEERYNSLLAQVHTALRLAGANPDLLRGFVESPHPGLETAYEGVRLGPDGRLDVERIRRNVSGGGEALARALTLEALDAFVSYALFSARNALPPEVAERLYRGYLDLQEGIS